MLAFAGCSQAADLANGIAWYAIIGMGTALLTLLAAAGLGDPPTAAAVVLGVTIAGTLAHSATTAPGGTTNLRQRRLGADEAALTALFGRFQRGQTIRVCLQVTALAGVLIMLAVTVTQ